MSVDVLNMAISEKDREEIKEFISVLLLLPAEDRAVLLSNANAFRVRRDIEKAKGKEWWTENNERSSNGRRR